MPFDNEARYHHLIGEDIEESTDVGYTGVFTIDEDEVKRVFSNSFDELNAEVSGEIQQVGYKVDNLYKLIASVDSKIEKLEKEHDLLKEEVEELIKKLKK